ncbi:MAG: hypothetical protein C0518_02550 [Opitutus sp.]|nr:hypothetical protein [Opitutus sp.]
MASANGDAKQSRMFSPLRSLTGWRETVRTLGLATLVCGVADITFVILGMLVRGSDPLRMLQGIAFSVLGRDTYQGGLMTAALGLLLHFGVAAGATGHYALLATFVRPVLRHPLIAGVLFGIYFHFLMQLVVLPLTLIPERPLFPAMWWVQLIAHATCVGPIIALVLSWREQSLMRGAASTGRAGAHAAQVA